MALGGLVAVEVIAELGAERDDTEQLLGREQIASPAGIEVFHGSAELGQVGANAGVAADGLHRSIQEAVGVPGRFGDFLPPHCGELVDFLPELRTVRIGGDQIVHKGINLELERGALFLLQRDQPCGLLRLHRRHHFGSLKLQLRFGGHASPFSAFGAKMGERSHAMQDLSCIILATQLAH